MRHLESRLQISCVNWFRYQYPKYKKLLFAVPNGGLRTARQGKALKSEGVQAGVSDLILSIPKKGFFSLFIEMKYGERKQSKEQEDFQREIEKHGGKYIICRSFDEFEREINFYLN